MTTHAPDWICDRCGHPLKRHGDPRAVDFIRQGTRCIVRGCPCDGWYPISAEMAPIKSDQYSTRHA